MPDPKAVAVPVDVLHSVRQVVDYDWQTEARDYEQHLPDERDGHIFCHLTKLDAFLETLGL